MFVRKYLRAQSYRHTIDLDDVAPKIAATLGWKQRHDDVMCIILPSDSARAHRARAHTVQSNAGEPRHLYLCIVVRNVPTLQRWCKHSTNRSPQSALQRWHKCRALGAGLSDTNHSNLVRALPNQQSQAGPSYYMALLG
jgi:hypothetical protein